MLRKSILLQVLGLVALLVVGGWALAGQAGAQPPVPGYFNADHHVAAPDSIRSISLSPLATDTSIADLVARVDGNRWHADVETLARFGSVPPNVWGTRFTRSAGNLAARDWISTTLASLGWTTSYHQFNMVGGPSFNVIGERVGERYPDEIYIVGAHFDSTSGDSNVWILAPGAEDNASGTAALLEIARVLQDQTPARTIRLIAFSGEEQGLFGSTAYVNYLQNVSHELAGVKGVYNLDMIGYTSNPASLHVVLESSNPAIYPWMGDFRDHLVSTAGTYTDLAVYTANGACCSDHAPFLAEQVPAVLVIGAQWFSYSGYHTSADLPANVVPAEGAEIIKAVVAALADKAGIVCIFADVNCDGNVNVLDLVELANHWRFDPAAGYDEYDLNDDGQINILDLQLAAQALAVR